MWEWNEAVVHEDGDRSFRGVRGGAYNSRYSSHLLAWTRSEDGSLTTPNNEHELGKVGFRVVQSVAQIDIDADGDGDVDSLDNCVDMANPDQKDTDGDGQGDACDADDDNDGVPDTVDPSPLNPRVCGDSDGDGCDDCSVGRDGFGPLIDSRPFQDGPDSDGDGICDTGDACPDTPPGFPVDSKGCTTAGRGDLDLDGDVDGEDLALFAACVSGPDIGLQSLCCRGADLDSDGDVDQSDFGRFQVCYAGAGRTPSAECGRYTRHRLFVSNGTGGGDWNSPSTWRGCAVPGNVYDFDSVLILTGDTVTQTSTLPKTLGVYLLEEGATHAFGSGVELACLDVRISGQWRRTDAQPDLIVVKNALESFASVAVPAKVQYDCPTLCELLNRAPAEFAYLGSCPSDLCSASNSDSPPMEVLWKEMTTHPAITTVAVDNEECDLHTVLRSCWYWPDGIDTTLPAAGQSCIARIVQGATDEDGSLSDGRYLHHFLDPISNGGLWGFSPANDWGASKSGYGYDDFVRHYYDSFARFRQADREQAAADTFYALGHLLHLVQDMAVPDHVRTDPHWGEWAGDASLIEVYANDRYAVAGSLSFFAPETSATPPRYTLSGAVPAMPTFQAHFDTGSWRGGMLAQPLGIPGLAEYTDINFLSTDTAGFTRPRPAVSETNLQQSALLADKGLLRCGMRIQGCYPGLLGQWDYIMKYARGPLDWWAEPVMHFAVVRYRSGSTLLPDVYYFPGMAVVGINDPLVLDDYCKLLLPKAAAYSTALVNYCFRGRLSVWLSSNSGGCKLAIRNLSNQTLHDGQWEYFYEAPNGTMWTFPCTFEYSGWLDPLAEFEAIYNDCLPPGWVVFRGIIGGEEGVAVGYQPGCCCPG